jgi:hypothetical protein
VAFWVLRASIDTFDPRADDSGQLLGELSAVRGIIGNIFKFLREYWLDDRFHPAGVKSALVDVNISSGLGSSW